MANAANAVDDTQISATAAAHQAATSWLQTVGTVAFISTIVTFLSNRPTGNLLADPNDLLKQGAVVIALLASILLAILAVGEAFKAANTLPHRADFASQAEWSRHVKDKDATVTHYIRWSQGWAYGSIALLVLALSLSWLWAAIAPAKPATYLLTQARSPHVVCGTLHAGGTAMMLGPYPVADAAKLTRVDACP